VHILAFQLPEKTFLSRKELAERWGCEINMIAHYIDDQQSLREAMRRRHLPPVSCIDVDPTTYIAPNMWSSHLGFLLGPEITGAQLDRITDGIDQLPEFIYLLSAEGFTPIRAPDYESYFAIAADLAGNRYRLVIYNAEFDLCYAAISAEYDRVIPLEEIQRFEELNSQMEIITEHDIAAHEAAEGPLPGREDQSNSRVSDSSYWQELQRKAERAITEFPDWRLSQQRVQKTGNLQAWLIETINLTEREAEIIKKVLSDIFPELQ
jgi:hypothetical protein